LEKTPGRRELICMARTMVARYCASFRHVPRRITLDIDDTLRPAAPFTRMKLPG
jgi:hypothetical protein